eukprot:TRINITY_DN28811_c0_g1_i1.p1 TRINITY_DN28811_c0_g1~~TRINITY_DN28811_c0_g1_i1.p1  ORF type:complete len:531 (+),score=118.36 TRINITY_DN28811_c0_g1_i1:155-1747(+)
MLRSLVGSEMCIRDSQRRVRGAIGETMLSRVLSVRPPSHARLIHRLRVPSSRTPTRPPSTPSVLSARCLSTGGTRASKLAMVRAENQVIQSLRELQGLPDLLAVGVLKNLVADVDAGRVSFGLQPIAGGIGDVSPDGATLRQLCEDKAAEVPWVKSVEVQLMRPAPASKGMQAGSKPNGLADVKHIVAVSSCKGGVGKSTVSMNLATALSQLGHSVGILDADIYGPSLPTMTGITPGRGLYADERVPELISPLHTHDGKLKLMSYGFAKDSAAVMRGPMVGSLVAQLATQTAWGALDYLIVDLPPGTGDIQLSLCQSISLSASVVVTTPQQISLIDVVKGVEMFQKLKVPTVAVVENMAHFDCEHGTRYYPFGRGSSDALVAQYGFPYSCTLPIEPLLSLYSDIGRPMAAQDDNSEVAQTFRDLGSALRSELEVLAEARAPETRVEMCSERFKIVAERGDQVNEISPYKLRMACKCAACVDEFTGQQRLQPEDVTSDVAPTSIEPKGNYAVEIGWTDGHSSIFPYEALLK